MCLTDQKAAWGNSPTSIMNVLSIKSIKNYQTCFPGNQVSIYTLQKHIISTITWPCLHYNVSLAPALYISQSLFITDRQQECHTHSVVAP